MSDWIKAGRFEEFKESEPKCVEIDEQPIMVVRIGEKMFACGGECTHYGGPLHEGVVLGETVTCPWHGARFGLSGAEDVPPLAPALDDVGHCEVKVEDGEVLIKAPCRAEMPEPEGKDVRRFVILGGGAAGNASAEMLRRLGFAGNIEIITAEELRPYDRPRLSKGFMAGDTAPEGVALRAPDFYDRLKIALQRNCTVTGLDLDGKELQLEGGGTLPYDKLLLATGGVPKALPAPGADLDGVYLLRSLADACALREAAAQARHAVVVGAGFIGAELASSFRMRDLDVTLVAPESVLMERVFGPEVGRYLQGLHEENGVRFRLGSGVKAFEGNGRVEKVVLEDGTTLEADLVAVGVGIRPAVDFLEGTGLVEDGRVPVDGALRTKAPDVYAAGDIAAIPGPPTGRPQRVEHWVHAERTGQHAARAMLGETKPYDEIPFFWTVQCKTQIKYGGYAPDYDRFAARGDVRAGDFLAGYYKDGACLAVAACGRSRDFFLAAELLRRNAAPSIEQLQDEKLDLAQLLA
jgi:NADPH-dependent 2,4-dienoyl-CoA reductase/sulfur reductase-like enzyme/nitrite reductase/ring-hydroxylating ferredoxin subunit